MDDHELTGALAKATMLGLKESGRAYPLGAALSQRPFAQ